MNSSQIGQTKKVFVGLEVQLYLDSDVAKELLDARFLKMADAVRRVAGHLDSLENVLKCKFTELKLLPKKSD